MKEKVKMKGYGIDIYREWGREPQSPDPPKAVPDFNSIPLNQCEVLFKCEVLFISTDGDDNDAEKVRLVFKETYNKDINCDNKVKNMKFDVIKQLDVDQLTICKEITEYGNIPDKTDYFYYVSGAAEISRSNYYNDDGEFVNEDKNISKKENYSVEITKDLYDYLLDVLDDKVEQNSMIKVVHGDEEFDRFHL